VRDFYAEHGGRALRPFSDERSKNEEYRTIAVNMSSLAIASPDLTILLDLEGIIQKATLSDTIPDQGLNGWVGMPWFETVGEVAGDKVRRIVEDARRSGVSAFRQITQRFPSGVELPMEFTTVRLGGKAGMIAIGRNLQAVGELQSRLIAAQHAREQDYWKLREVETRYRLLFDASHEAVLLLTTDSLRVLEANPAAIRALGLAPGWEFTPEIAQQDVDAFQSMLARVREQGRAPGILLHLGPVRAGWMVRASMMTTESGQVFLLQIAPFGAVLPGETHGELGNIEALIERLPDAFVVMDGSGVIRRANGAFLDLVQVGAEGAVTGENLARWVGTAGADVPGLLANIQRHRVVRLLATKVQGELGGETDVEVSAAGSSDNRPRLIGAMIRDVGRRLPPPGDDKQLAFELAALSGRIGDTPLLQLVRDTTGVVERHYIEEALVRADGNRTAAAEILGLSRQSLYVKLARYGLDGSGSLLADRSE